MGLLASIREGKYDNDLERIINEIGLRRRVISSERFYEINIGDRVRFIASIRPTYLAHQPGTVVGKKVKKLLVRLDHPVGRFQGDIRCGPTQVEPIPDMREGGSDEN